MQFINVTAEFGILIRKDALALRKAPLEAVLAIFEISSPMDESDSLLSFGPHFGEEAALSLVRSLERLGLVYVEDFFMLAAQIPDWCQLGACCAMPDRVRRSP